MVTIRLRGRFAETNGTPECPRHLEHSFDELKLGVYHIDQIHVSVALGTNSVGIGCVKVYGKRQHRHADASIARRIRVVGTF